jgi:hypothetical protein
MAVRIRESRAGTAKKSWDVFDERKVPTVAFLKHIKVHNVKLANSNEPSTVGVRFST